MATHILPLSATAKPDRPIMAALDEAVGGTASSADAVAFEAFRMRRLLQQLIAIAEALDGNVPFAADLPRLDARLTDGLKRLTDDTRGLRESYREKRTEISQYLEMAGEPMEQS